MSKEMDVELSISGLRAAINAMTEGLEDVITEIEILEAQMTEESVVRQDELSTLVGQIQAVQAAAEMVMRKAVRNTARRCYPGWRDPGLLVEEAETQGGRGYAD